MDQKTSNDREALLNKEGVKNDSAKMRMDLISIRFLWYLGAVLTFGTDKYAARNWEKGVAWSRLYGACIRHMTAWWNGEELDPETGLSHLAHAGFCIMALSEYEETHKELDDRPESTTLQTTFPWRKPVVDKLRVAGEFLDEQDVPQEGRMLKGHAILLLNQSEEEFLEHPPGSIIATSDPVPDRPCDFCLHEEQEYHHAEPKGAWICTNCGEINLP